MHSFCLLKKSETFARLNFTLTPSFIQFIFLQRAFPPVYFIINSGDLISFNEVLCVSFILKNSKNNTLLPNDDHLLKKKLFIKA